MLFSIIVPIYNAKDFIGSCIESVKKQAEKNYELILIDDGSTDGSIEVIESKLLEVNTKLIRVHNGGVSVARNIGLDAAEGKYILFLDADDELSENALSCYKEVIEKEHYPDLIFSGFYRVYPKKESAFRLHTRDDAILYADDDKKEFNPYISRFTGCVWAKCYKKSLIGKERFNTELSLCEDAEFNFRVFGKMQKCVYLNKLLYRYNYIQSSTIRKYNPQYIERYLKALGKIQKETVDTDMYSAFLEFAGSVFNVICFNVIFSRENPAPVNEKCNIIRTVREDVLYNKIFHELKLTQLPFKHRVTIAMAKRKYYYGLYCISLMNYMINKVLY